MDGLIAVVVPPPAPKSLSSSSSSSSKSSSPNKSLLPLTKLVVANKLWLGFCIGGGGGGDVGGSGILVTGCGRTESWVADVVVTTACGFGVTRCVSVLDITDGSFRGIVEYCDFVMMFMVSEVR